MNFTTDLPKKDPIVSYIVASAVKCEKFFPGSGKEGPVFRMHAVIIKRKQKNPTSSSKGSDTVPIFKPVEDLGLQYILCHVRRVKNKFTKEEYQ